MVNKEEFLNLLTNYFDEGIITDCIYMSEKMCVLTYADMYYVCCPFLLTKDHSPFGFVAAKENVEAAIDNEYSFWYELDYQMKNDPNHLCVFSKKNLSIYKEHVKKIKNTKVSKIDFDFNEKIKKEYGVKKK